LNRIHCLDREEETIECNLSGAHSQFLITVIPPPSFQLR
jgi:hypothetical protein